VVGHFALQTNKRRKRPLPELPDLEVYKHNIYGRLTSKRLVGLGVFSPQKVRASNAAVLDSFTGRELLRIERFGKELIFDFDGRRTIAAHLMLNGEISIVKEEAVRAIPFKIFSIRFEQETIVFSDRGGLCTIRCMPLPDRTPDAFGASFTPEYFLAAARAKPRVNVKAFLIDQKVVKGIGNAYADEILWAARISPHSLVGKIPQDKLLVLYQAIADVLHDAVDAIKRISPHMISGEERRFLKVHNKTIKQTESGHRIIVERIASKITFHTEEQVVYV